MNAATTDAQPRVSSSARSAAWKMNEVVRAHQSQAACRRDARLDEDVAGQRGMAEHGDAGERGDLRPVVLGRVRQDDNDVLVVAGCQF